MKKLLLVVALIGLTGCGMVRALVGPTPELAAAAPHIEAALDRDSAANPEQQPQNERSKEALDGEVHPVFPPLPPIPGLPWLEPAALIVSSILGSLGARHVLKKREAKKAAKAKGVPTVA